LDENGRMVVNLEKELGLSVVNWSEKCKGSWTWAKNSSKSAIDYVLACPDMYNDVQLMVVDEEGDMGSIGADHNFIEVSLKGSITPEKVGRKVRPRWALTDNTNWTKYRECLGEKLVSWEQEAGDVKDTLSMAYDKMVGVIKEAAKEVIGLRKPGLRGANRGKQLIRAIAARNSAAKRWRAECVKGRKDQCGRGWIAYRKCSSRVKKLYSERNIQRATRWREKVEKSGNLGSKWLWQTMQEKKGQIHTIKEEGHWFVGEEEIKSILVKHFAALGWNSSLTSETATPGVTSGVVSGVNTSEILDEKISRQEVTQAMKRLKNMKASGQDDIPNELLKNGGECMGKALTSIFQACQEAGWTPPEWNVEVVKLLHKGGPREVLDNYRGISLTSNVGKVLAGILVARLNKEIENRGLLPEGQAGFRVGRSVEDNIFILNSIIEAAKWRRSPLILAFIDVRKAYDTVNRAILWKKLGNMGISKAFVGLLQSLYRDTKRSIEWKSYITPAFATNTGLRQGCPLSPLLFALYVAHVPAAIDKVEAGATIGDLKFSNLFYADDIVLMAENKPSMRRSVGVVYDELGDLGLEINFKKSKVIRMGPGSLMPCDWAIADDSGQILGVIEESSQYKYLGVYIGKRKIGAEHMRRVRSRIPYATMSVIARARQSMDKRKVAEALWRISMKRSLLFGCGAMVITKATQKRLEVAQNKIIKWILGVHWSASATMATEIVQWKSIETEIAQQVLMWWSKVLRMGEDRWPYQIYQEMIRQEQPSQWLSQLRRISEENRVSPWRLDTSEWKKGVEDSVLSRRRSEQGRKEGIRWKVVEPGGTGMQGISEVEQTRLRQIVCNDEWSVAGNRGQPRCPVCCQVWGDWRYHVIWGCDIGGRPTQDSTVEDEKRERERRIEKMIQQQQWSELRIVGQETYRWVARRMEEERK